MAKQHILIVDDDQKSLRVLEISLKKAGFSVTIAANGIDALEKVAVSVPELIISDVKMPKMNGYQFCQRVKDDPKLASIPFIFLTSQRSVEDKVRGLELGVDDYLTKPIYIRELIARVRLLLQKKEKESLEKVDQQNMFQGSLADLGVVDLLQTIEIGRKTGQILLTSGSKSGVMYLQNGRIIDATCGPHSGARAVYRLLTWNDGAFKIDFKPVDRPETIELSTQGLIMEGMRRLDEFERLAEQIPSLDSILIIDPQELLDQYPEGFPSKAGEILQLFNGKRSIIDVADECGLDDLPALNIISKFYFQGLLKELQAEGQNTIVQPNGTITMAGPNPAAAMAKIAPDSGQEIEQAAGQGSGPAGAQPPPGAPGIEPPEEEIEIEIPGAELVRTPDPELTQPPFTASQRSIPRQAESPLSESRLNEMFDEVSAAEGGGEGDFEFDSPETSHPRHRHLRAVPSPATAEERAPERSQAAPSKPPAPPVPKSAPPKPAQPETKAAPSKSTPPAPKVEPPVAPPLPLPEPPPVRTTPPPPPPPVQGPPPVAPSRVAARLDEVEAEEIDDSPAEVPGDSGYRTLIAAVIVSVVVTLLVVAGAGTFLWTGYLKPILDKVAGAQAGLRSLQPVSIDFAQLDRLAQTYAPAELRSVIQQIDRAGAASDPLAGPRHSLATARLGFLTGDSRLVNQGTLAFDRLPKDVRESSEGKLIQSELEIYRDRNELARQMAATLEKDGGLNPSERALATVVRGFAQGKAGQIDAAFAAIAPVANENSDLVIAPFVLAWLSDAGGDSAKAETWASQVVRQNPMHGPAHLIIARAKRKSADTQGALAELALAEQADASDPRPAVERADLHVKITKEYDTAGPEIDGLLGRDVIRSNAPLEGWLLALKSLVLLEKADTGAARVAYEQAKALDRTRPELDDLSRRLAGARETPPPPRPVAASPEPSAPAAKADYAALGRAAFKKGQYKKATDLLSKASNEHPDDAKLWFDFGVAAIQCDDSGRAITAFSHSAMIDDSNAEAHYYLGQLYSSVRKNSQAVLAYERFLKLAPNHPNAPLAKAILQKLKK